MHALARTIFEHLQPYRGTVLRAFRTRPPSPREGSKAPDAVFLGGARQVLPKMVKFLKVRMLDLGVAMQQGVCAFEERRAGVASIRKRVWPVSFDRACWPQYGGGEVSLHGEARCACRERELRRRCL